MLWTRKTLENVSLLLANRERFHFFLLTPAALERSSIIFLFLESRAFFLSAHLSKLCLHSSILFFATSRSPCATAASSKSLFLMDLVNLALASLNNVSALLRLSLDSTSDFANFFSLSSMLALSSSSFFQFVSCVFS